ncbi:MAG: hypothetical protein M3Z54_14445 [Gemmatimonadota bacterium]|nr:hypothetical protein [Gemmatimonadota bacterium]
MPLAIAIALVGCKARDTSGASKSANAQTWAPEKLTSVQGVPATEIESLIEKKLDGSRLPKIDDDQYGHITYFTTYINSAMTSTIATTSSFQS